MTDQNLAYFVDTWVHQDVLVLYGSLAGAALDFAGSPEHDAPALAAALRELLEVDVDQRLVTSFRALGAGYAPPAPGQLRRELTEALTALDEQLATRPGDPSARKQPVRREDPDGTWGFDLV